MWLNGHQHPHLPLSLLDMTPGLEKEPRVCRMLLTAEQSPVGNYCWRDSSGDSLVEQGQSHRAKFLLYPLFPQPTLKIIQKVNLHHNTEAASPPGKMPSFNP